MAGGSESTEGPGLDDVDSFRSMVFPNWESRDMETTPIDPLAGLDEDDYEPGAPTSLGVDGRGNPVEDEFQDSSDGTDDDSDDMGSSPDEDGPSSPDGGDPDPRGPEPYIITEDEFFGECETHQKLTITYYRGDRTLCDDQGVPVPDVRGTIGLGTTDKFGKTEEEGRNVIYVRNPKLEADFEVCLDYGSYIGVVLHYGTASPKPPRPL